MKFIHLADAHLDSPFRGLSFLPSEAFKKIRNSSEQSFEKIVDIALSENVDLVLIAGDTFDSNQPSPKSQLFFAKEIKRLTDAKIQVVMIFGNHDHLPKEELLVTPSPYFKLLGPNEKVEKVELSTNTGFKYDVVGFSYLNNHIEKDMLATFPEKDSHYTFGLMHAQEKSSVANQNVYAPFSLKTMRELNYNYFALGHIHLRQVLSQTPLIAYSGNIQGRHINELGKKGCLLGEIDEKSGQTKTHFIETAPILWQKAEIVLDDVISKADLSEKLQSLGPIKQTTYFCLKIKGAEYLTSKQQELVKDHDFWKALSENLPYESQIVDIRLSAKNTRLALSKTDQFAFQQAAEEIFSNNDVEKVASSWIKKDKLAQAAINRKDFINQIQALTQLKLAQKLKGLNDETETN